MREMIMYKAIILQTMFPIQIPIDSVSYLLVELSVPLKPKVAGRDFIHQPYLYRRGASCGLD